MRRLLVAWDLFVAPPAGSPALGLELQCVDDALLRDDDIRQLMELALELHEAHLQIHDSFQGVVHRKQSFHA